MLSESALKEAAMALAQRNRCDARFYVFTGHLMFGIGQRPPSFSRPAIVADCPNAEKVATDLNSVLAGVYAAKLTEAEAAIATAEDTMKGSP